MIAQELQDILREYRTQGWVPEPAAKKLLSLAGLPVTRHFWAKTPEEAFHFAEEIGYPLVAKVVSAEAVHKSDQGGVALGICNHEGLATAYERFRQFRGFAGVLVEEMLTGLELIVGAKIDFQFGPVILLGMGGTRAEVYRDIALRMAPLDEAVIASMIKGLRGHRLLEGYRGEHPVNIPELSRLIMGFAELVVEMEPQIDSIDLNPLMCTREKCVIADARIILAQPPAGGQASP